MKHPHDEIDVPSVAGGGGPGGQRASAGSRLKQIMSVGEGGAGQQGGAADTNGVGGSKVKGKLQKKDRHGRWQVRSPPPSPSLASMLLRLTCATS